jgi:hypothetical protein
MKKKHFTCEACSNETYQGTVLDKGVDVKIVPMGDILGFCSSVVEVFILLGCGAVALGNWCPLFRDMPVSSRVRTSNIFEDFELVRTW